MKLIRVGSAHELVACGKDNANTSYSGMTTLIPAVLPSYSGSIVYIRTLWRWKPRFWIRPNSQTTLRSQQRICASSPPFPHHHQKSLELMTFQVLSLPNLRGEAAAPGRDGITTVVLRLCTNGLAESLATLYDRPFSHTVLFPLLTACKCYVTAQRPAKLVLNQDSVPYKSMLEVGRLTEKRPRTCPIPRYLLKCDAPSCEEVVKIIPTSPRRNKELCSVGPFINF